MPKQVEKTERLIAEIRRSLSDPNVDTSTFAVFETRLVSTEAIKQKGFHNGARLSRGTLGEMAEFINAEGSNLPLQIMHERSELPIGRVFSAELSELPTGDTELIGLFYIPDIDAVNAKLIASIETGIISEVSVGVLNKSAFCSECDFDYLGAEADFENLWTLTCDDGHTIGEDGCHVRLVGLDIFSELSLVNQGAGKEARIRSKDKQRIEFSAETVKRLAASSSQPIEAHHFLSTTKLTKTKTNPAGEHTMPGIEVAEFAAINKSLGKVEVELSIAEKTIETLTASLGDTTKELEELKASQGTDLTELKASKDALELKISDISDVVSEDLKAALVATGEKEADVPSDVSAMLSLIKEKGLKLHQMFGAGNAPRSSGQKTDVDSKEDSARRKANFKINSQY